MLFLFIIPIWAGFGNYFVPLHIGAMDMAFPRINALSFWMLPPAAILMFAGFLVDGGAAAGGWTAYTPLSRQARHGYGSMDPRGTSAWACHLRLVLQTF